jgi:hypothetical protein
VTFPRRAEFFRTKFDGGADFIEATFAGKIVNFREADFEGSADFTRATFGGRADFFQVRVAGDASFIHAIFVEDGGLQIVEAGSKERSTLDILQGTPPQGAASMLFYGTSLDAVDLEKMDGSKIRFREALNIDKLTFREVKWPVHGSGYKVADEEDLKARIEAIRLGKPSSYKRGEFTWHEVERIYRSLRKIHEDRNDRVGAHKWYYAEMEIGRRYPTWRQRRAEAAEQRRALATESTKRESVLSRSSQQLNELFPLRHFSRNFYKWTSNYGLSAIRAALWLLLIGLVAFGLFMIPSPEICPSVEANRAGIRMCVGAEGVAKTVMLSIFFQPPPEGISFSGFLGQAVWLLTRLFGAAMLLSIGVAFRNQVAR